MDQKRSAQTEGIVDTLDRVETPKMFKVILLNDDFISSMIEFLFLKSIVLFIKHMSSYNIIL